MLGLLPKAAWIGQSRPVRAAVAVAASRATLPTHAYGALPGRDFNNSTLLFRDGTDEAAFSSSATLFSTAAAAVGLEILIFSFD